VSAELLAIKWWWNPFLLLRTPQSVTKLSCTSVPALYPACQNVTRYSSEWCVSPDTVWVLATSHVCCTNRQYVFSWIL